MASQSHKIQKEYLDVEIYGTESEGMTLQRTLPDFCQNQLMPAIEKVLNRHLPMDVYLTIDRLDINAGTMTLNRLEHDLPEMVAKVLGQYLCDISQTDELSNVLDRGNLQRKTEQQRVTDAFIFFLKHGTLPWSFHLSSGSGFEELIQGFLSTQEGRGASFELKTELIETLASVTSRKRLARQFSQVFLENLLTWFSVEGRRALEGILLLLRTSDVALNDVKKLELEIWESAFACIASGRPLTKTYLRGDVDALVGALGARGASLATLINFYWSDLPKNEDFQASSPAPANSSQQSEGADNVQKVVHDESTKHGSLLSEGEEQSHSERGKETQAKLLTAPTSLSQQGEGPDKAQKAVHDESAQHGSLLSEGEEQSHPVKAHHQQCVTKAKEPVSLPSIKHPDAKAGIYTALAGLVLLHPFLPQLFRALGIADDEKLLLPDRAIYLLYFLATGRTNAMEYELVIPKILCHFPLASAVESNASLVADEQEEAIGLLAAVIRHWEVLKNTGTDGLRETFLKRSGKLSQRDDGEWLLQVESNSFDILLEQLPWGISMIQLPWMSSILRVEWV